MPVTMKHLSDLTPEIRHRLRSGTGGRQSIVTISDEWQEAESKLRAGIGVGEVVDITLPADVLAAFDCKEPVMTFVVKLKAHIKKLKLGYVVTYHGSTIYISQPVPWP